MKKRLTKEIIYRLYEEYNTPPHVIKHCIGVCDTAMKIGKALVDNGIDLDLDVIYGAAMAHDVARLIDDHGLVMGKKLYEMGFENESRIVSVHMRYDGFKDLSKINEIDIVCLADRTVKEDKYVGIDKRIEYIIDKAGRKPEITARILQKKEETIKFINMIERIVGKSIDEIVLGGQMTNREKLDKILKLVEKPARYIGGEVNIAKKNISHDTVRFAFAFPDTYEIGMSYTGLQILYNILNKEKNIYCERTFAPAVDMEELMRENSLPLFTLETKTSVKEMDFLGFTLQYEMSFTNIVNMLELSDIPILSKDRNEEDPIIIAGGPCAYNPEPLCDFIDMFLIGDGEELLPKVLNLYYEMKGKATKEDFYKEACKIEGVYIPSFYDVKYNEDGTIKGFQKLYEEAPEKVLRGFVTDLDKTQFPIKPIVPLIEVVHDRSVVETFRGCTRGCRFCQAGMIYRPVRERSVDTIVNVAKKQLEATGHDELSLLSLSTSDYSRFEDLALTLMNYCKKCNVSLSLPSLRLDSFSFKVLDEIQGYKKSGLTFAVEAGTQRLRDVINKGVTEEDLYSAIEQAIDLGWRNIKLYFMIGLPFEDYESLDGIARIAQNIVNIKRRLNGGKLDKFNVTVSVSNFVPKSNTPFQWFGQNTAKEFEEKHNYLAEKLRIKGVTFNYHDNETSVLEAVFARGDRRLGKTILRAHQLGCKFDGWTEHFKADAWHQAFEETNVDIDFYTTRHRSLDEVLPWSIIDCGISNSFLLREWEKAKEAITTNDCRHGCVGCGINKHVKCPLGGIYE